jgi:hypothetical protein
MIQITRVKRAMMTRVTLSVHAVKIIMMINHMTTVHLIVTWTILKVIWNRRVTHQMTIMMKSATTVIQRVIIRVRSTSIISSIITI